MAETRLTEAQAWREIAEQIDARGVEMGPGLYGFLDFGHLIEQRLRLYDNAAEWCYGPEDDYANMANADAVLACLWLALEAEAEARIHAESTR